MHSSADLDAAYDRAAAAIASADALLIGAGAGMGVDSGLPDFRGDAGFWKAYPPFRGKSFPQISNPLWFSKDPAQAWGFFGHRLNLYRDTAPHAGFALLRRWAEARPAGSFVYTSNVDGHFQRAGFPDDRVVECHGSIHFLQCAKLCTDQIWPADDTAVTVDEATIRAVGDLPRCPHCRAFARPNILMFGDGEWLESRTMAQHRRYNAWLWSVAARRVVAIEFGAGLAIPTVRIECEDRAAVVIRVNPREAKIDPPGIALPVGALDAIRAIDARLRPIE